MINCFLNFFNWENTVLYRCPRQVKSDLYGSATFYTVKMLLCMLLHLLSQIWRQKWRRLTRRCQAFILKMPLNQTKSTSASLCDTWPACPWFSSVWHVSYWIMSFPKKPGGKALDILQNLPRITLANLRPEPGSRKEVLFVFIYYLNAPLELM